MKRDRVTPEMREQILDRDGACLLWKMDNDHQCRDTFGNPHAPNDRGRLTLEHVHDGYGLMGRRAPSDARHLLALCGGSNTGVPSKADRAAFRAYLERVNADPLTLGEVAS